MEWNKLLSLETQVERESEPKEFEKYPISDLEKDYKAIISSAAFRRLQDKTQVFPLDKSDFVRTRLTHSIEVATIARQLGIMVTQNTSSYLPEDFQKNLYNESEKIPAVLSCAGLLHDIGNPPFGHFGEVIIGEWFQNEFEDKNFRYKGKSMKSILKSQMINDLEHFEGNAQALRILSKISNKDISHDVNLTKGVMSSLIKYPTNSLEYTGKGDSDIRKHKLGYYYSERESFLSIAQETGTLLSSDDVARHPLAYLMEAADDVAYATADLEDAYKKGLFSLKEFILFFEREMQNYEDFSKPKLLIEDLKEREQNAVTSEERMVAFQNWMDYSKQWFMYCVAFSFSKNYSQIMNGTYNKELIEETFHGPSIRIFKKAMAEFAYEESGIVKLELAARKILSSLLDDFIHAVIYYDEKDEAYQQSKIDVKLCNLIPENLKDDYLRVKTEDEYENLYLRFLMVTDFISGMTDSYAKNLYQKLNGID